MSDLLDDNRIFRTQHSTQWHRQIAQNNTVLLSEVGSTLHGVSVAADDTDEMGVCIPPRHVALGVSASTSHLFEQYEFRTQPVGVRSGPGDIDRVIYSLRKFARLAGQGNPTVLMILFSPEDKLRQMNWIGQKLRDSRDMFISKDCGRRFEGYMKRQCQRMTGELSQRTNRPELIEKYGYDTKFAYHALRLAIQGTQLMQQDGIKLPMHSSDCNYLLAIRQGKYNKQHVLNSLDQHISILQKATNKADLPEHASFRLISHRIAEWHEEWWRR